MHSGRMNRVCAALRIALIPVFAENPEYRAVQMQLTALRLSCHGAQIASRIPYAVFLPQSGMIGDQNAQGGSCRSENGAGFNPGGFADAEFRQQGPGGIDQIFPVERPVMDRDMGAEPVGGGVQHLFPGDVIEAGCYGRFFLPVLCRMILLLIGAPCPS